eukprot:TRINITY_DN24673_c0_g1_i1.p1 TRINITY_DN24673_c0_g1~~TRINITY_DN24673_c0_g1_i1.p1  ORF type:complete len:279 (+),score=17.20 TRINITY_DN24673_c0_g1_i1:71-907(+)
MPKSSESDSDSEGSSDSSEDVGGLGDRGKDPQLEELRLLHVFHTAYSAMFKACETDDLATYQEGHMKVTISRALVMAGYEVKESQDVLYWDSKSSRFCTKKFVGEVDVELGGKIPDLTVVKPQCRFEFKCYAPFGSKQTFNAEQFLKDIQNIRDGKADFAIAAVQSGQAFKAMFDSDYITVKRKCIRAKPTVKVIEIEGTKLVSYTCRIKSALAATVLVGYHRLLASQIGLVASKEKIAEKDDQLKELEKQGEKHEAKVEKLNDKLKKLQMKVDKSPK